jgi:hypothetical protein
MLGVGAISFFGVCSLSKSFLEGLSRARRLLADADTTRPRAESDINHECLSLCHEEERGCTRYAW